METLQNLCSNRNTGPWRNCNGDNKSSLNNNPMHYYYRLDSESSVSDEGTESICSLQGKETELAKDTDTDTKSESDAIVEIEYDIASFSDTEHLFQDTSSGAEADLTLFAGAATAAVLYDKSLENFITDSENSDTSSVDTYIGIRDFWTCIQCKARKNNSLYRYCQKCFQDRKTILPPRPRRRKKRKSRNINNETNRIPVKLDTLNNCLSGLSQDSGISLSMPSLELHKIKIPEHLNPSTSCQPEGSSITKNNNNNILLTRKRQLSESSSLSEYEPKRVKKNEENLNKLEHIANNNLNNIKIENNTNNNDNNINNEESTNGLSETKELCITCNIMPKNGIFLHGNIAHMCCCYKCSMRTWKLLKRCPICNRRINNVVKLFTH